MKFSPGKSVLAATAAACAATAFAQDPAQQRPVPEPAPQQQAPAPPPAPAPVPNQQAAAAEVTDSQLDTFTTIYVDLQEMNAEFQQELAGVETEDEALELQARMQQDSVAAIEEHEWSVDEYNQVAEAINAQPDVLERAFELIEEKSS
jgi:hypothetical protein